MGPLMVNVSPIFWVLLSKISSTLWSVRKLRSVLNTSTKARPLNKSTTPSLLCVKQFSNVCFSGLSNVSTKLLKPNRRDPISSVSWILLDSRSLSITPSISCVSTTPTNVSNSSSTTTCSCLNRKNTRRKASSGNPSISVWIWPKPLTLLKNQEVSWPCWKKNALCQRPLMLPTLTNCTSNGLETTRCTKNQHQRKPNKEVETSSSIITLDPSDTPLPDGWKRTRIPSTSTPLPSSPKPQKVSLPTSSKITTQTKPERERVQLSRPSVPVTSNRCMD